MTLLLAVLLAYFLDPVVNVLAKLHIPRSIGALFALLAMTSIVWRVGLSAGDPRGPIRRGLASLQHCVAAMT